MAKNMVNTAVLTFDNIFVADYSNSKERDCYLPQSTVSVLGETLRGKMSEDIRKNTKRHSSQEWGENLETGCKEAGAI